MPLTFSYIAIAANKSLLHREGFHIDDTNWTWRDMLDISKAFSKALDDGTRYRYAFPSNQYVLPWEVEYMRFIDREKKTCSFNSKEFIEILELSKEMMDSNIISPDIGWGSRDAFSPANKDRLLFVYVVVDSEGQIDRIFTGLRV